jgi:periplasmic divalent cation tolerance protein
MHPHCPLFMISSQCFTTKEDMLSKLVACYVTVPDRAVGERIGRALIEKRMAACVNIIPGVVSMYRWAGAVQQDEELLLMIKSQECLVKDIVSEVKSLHPYDCPEVISVALGDGNLDYLEWVRRETTKPSATDDDSTVASESLQPPQTAP